MNKTILLVASAALIASSASATSDTYDVANARPESGIAKARAHVKSIAKANELSAKVWKPGIVATYGWDSENSLWVEFSHAICTYYEDGKLKTSGSQDYYTLYTYNDNGQVASETEYQAADDADIVCGTTTYKYDPIVTDFVIETVRTTEWGSSTDGTEITRNAVGNVTKVRDYWLSSEDNSKQYSGDELAINYGPDGRANEIFEYYHQYESNTVEIYTHLYNIEWENTDGQILYVEFDDYNSDSYFGANRIKKATFTDDELPHPADITVVYDGVSFKQQVVMNGKVIQSFDYTALENYGSFTSREYEEDWDSDDEGGEVIYYIDYSRNVTREERYDSYGNLLLDESTYSYQYSDGDTETDYEKIVGEVTYDTTYGYPVEYIMKSLPWNGTELENSMRLVWGDYRAFDSIGNIAADNAADAPVEIYNLSGVKVDNPIPGLYIIRKGNTATKRILR